MYAVDWNEKMINFGVNVERWSTRIIRASGRLGCFYGEERLEITL